MKKDIFLNQCLEPLVMILLGLILIASPDSASALIAAILGWILIAVAVGCGIAAIASSRSRGWKVAFTIIFAIAGRWLHTHPLMLAYAIGRFCGMFLWITGFQSIRYSLKNGRRCLLPGIQAAIGLLLFLFIPMSVSRLVFTLCGIVVLVVGIAMLLGNLRPQKRLQDPENPDIVDAL